MPGSHGLAIQKNVLSVNQDTGTARTQSQKNKMETKNQTPIENKNTEFKCAVCNKTTTSTDGFPYKQGWRYLYKLFWKKDPDFKQESFDRHFCSRKCLTEFVYEATKQENPNPKFLPVTISPVHNDAPNNGEKKRKARKTTKTTKRD